MKNGFHLRGVRIHRYVSGFIQFEFILGCYDRQERSLDASELIIAVDTGPNLAVRELI